MLDGYSTDRSILKIRPKAVAVPRTTSDIRKLVRFSNQLALKKFKLPVTVRGSGLDKTGAAIGSGLIISMEEMNSIQEVDPRQRLVRLQVGVTLGALKEALSLHGLTLPVAGDNCETIGGLLANNYRGALAKKYGNISSRISQAEIVLSSGDVIQTEHLKARNLSKKKGLSGFEGEFYRRLDNFLSDNTAAFEDIDKNSRTGYAGISKIKTKNGTLDLLPAFFGSQGTLGIITEVILSCELATDLPQYFVTSFTTANAALGFIIRAARLHPSEINVYDANLFHEALKTGKKFRPIKTLPENGMIVSVTFDDSRRRHRSRKLKKLIAVLNKSTRFVTSNDKNYPEFIELQSVLSTYLNNPPRKIRAPLADDAFIPSDQLKRYFSGIVELEQKHGISLPIFGSALTGNYSVRPEIDLSVVAGRQFALAFLREYNNLVTSCGGSLTGGSPEGRTKAIFVNANLSPKIRELYEELKDIFDPNHILNPDVKQGANLRSVVRSLRTSYTPGIIKK